MAEGTRLFQLSESLKECQDAILQQQTSTTSFQNQQHTHNTSFQQQLTEMTEMLRTLVNPQVGPPPEHPQVANPGVVPLLGREDRRYNGRDGRRDARDDRDDQAWLHLGDRRDQMDEDFHHGDRLFQTLPLRLEFPCFDGDNPAGWTYKVNQFFNYYQTPLHHRIRMASFHMEGEALIWFQDADESGQFPTWDAFVQALLIRFGPAYDDPMEELMRLRQSSFVADYTAQFEAHSNRLRGVSERNRLSCFSVASRTIFAYPSVC
jgi:hypothetical protein